MFTRAVAAGLAAILLSGTLAYADGVEPSPRRDVHSRAKPAKIAPKPSAAPAIKPLPDTLLASPEAPVSADTTHDEIVLDNAFFADFQTGGVGRGVEGMGTHSLRLVVVTPARPFPGRSGVKY